ncbi:MAG: hypothetical protein Q8L20_03300 [Gammaproteobacteria bacterium]|nr:hypothetical protein [Gammaproteobacteria bacterium]
MFAKNIIRSALVGAMALAGAVHAAWNLDEDGFGFVGKGDVQTVYGWNNNQLQRNAGDVEFRALTGMVTDYEWMCSRNTGDQTQDRSRSTTTETSGVLTSVARERNQVTGFNLSGWDEENSSSVTTSEGNVLGSCPANWTASAITEETYALPGSGLQVSIDGLNWYSLP